MKSFSQSGQDLFVYDVCFNSNKSGFFVDLGAGYDESIDGVNSNTLLLEQNGWSGLAIDCSMKRLRDRTCVMHAEMIGQPRSISTILSSLNCPKIIDYLSIDLDGVIDCDVLKDIIQSGYEFKVLTFEHDLYSGKPSALEIKRSAYEYLIGQGYVRAVDNVGVNASLKQLHNNMPYEDWYINPKYIMYKTIMEKIH